MKEPSFDLCKDSVIGKKRLFMESDDQTDEKSSRLVENRVEELGNGMCLNGEVLGSGFVDDENFGAKLHAINLVVDLSSSCYTKELDGNAVGSDVTRVNVNDVECSEKEGEYEFWDLVWGKVKNYPWWPGQIINPSVATDEAMMHLKKDGFLVAYFGDQTFSFSELHNIKPFRVNFCEMESQSNGEDFVRAVTHSLHEAARRVEFGLACSCLSEEVYGKVKSQIVVNSGIRKEFSRIDGGDRFLTVNSFNPANTFRFMVDLAKDPYGKNRLDVLKIKGQLSAFNRWKGYHQLQINQVLDKLDDEFDFYSSAPHSKGKLNARGRPRKHKHLFDDGLSPSKKVRCLSELMLNGYESASDMEYKPKKRGRKKKAGKLNKTDEESQSQSQTQILTAYEFLSQIYLAARNPIEGRQNLHSLVKFSSDFRNYRLRDGLADIKDSYWTDMTIVTESDDSPKPNKENSATALTFKFRNLDSVPSVKKLHEIFRRYGALQETETRVLKKKKCIKLVFERKCDAETAFSSSGKFSIFGPALVSYRLNFSPTLRKTDAAGKKRIKSAKKLQPEK